MASRKALNAENLSALGADRLAELLIEVTTGNADTQRRLRLELAGAISPQDLATEVAKRLATISRSKGKLDWRRKKKLATELEFQRKSIVETLAPTQPAVALDLLFKLLDLAPGVYQRSRGDAAEITAVFDQALCDLCPVSTDTDVVALADRLFIALTKQNQGPYGGQYNGLLPQLADVLGKSGLDHLAARLAQLESTPAIALISAQLADARGDVDGFIAHLPHPKSQSAIIAVAQRLVSAERPGEALEWLARLPGKFGNEAAEVARINALEALEQTDDAQARRLECFTISLLPDFLRTYLKRLPDFDDEEAEQVALDQAANHDNAAAALRLFAEWPSTDRAAELVRKRSDELDGNDYLLLTPVADMLEEHTPLAATLVLRTMISHALENRQTARYRHCADHLNKCSALAAWIEDWDDTLTHRRYVAQLRQRYARSVGFWARVVSD